ncbi:MAG: acyl carrier protein [Pseudomonadota bacterium]|nr:acyl carrier protein [Pseudomonadota bacterium]
MNMQIFDTIDEVLTEKFNVDAIRIRPDSTLESLGLDSLSLIEFVFAIEDRFSVRIPEEQLDPRQAGITLGHLSDVLEDALLVPSLSTDAKGA